MTSQIHLVRHAEAAHNVSRDKSHHDPPLTDFGLQEASKLVHTFPHQERIALVLTSPLRRAVQTSLAGFSHILDESSPRPQGNAGINNGAKFIVYPLIQPGREIQCDTGSNRAILETEFPGLDFSVLKNGWQKNELVGMEEEDRRNLTLRELARVVRGLKGQQKKDIVLVTHGIVHEVSTGGDCNNWPRAGWQSFVLEGDDEGGYRLQAVEKH